MATLGVKLANGDQQTYTIFKRLTTIGFGSGADIVIAANKVEDIAAYISQTLNTYNLIIPKGKSAAFVNGKSCLKHELKEGDEFRLNDTLFCFSLLDKSPQHEPQSEQAEVMAYRRMLGFSQRIAKEKDIEELLRTLLQEIVDLCNAEHGFLVLVEDGKPKVKVQESKIASDLADLSPMSDSIVKKVIESKQAIVVNDALHDQEFSSSLSVINFQLSSIMCVPLIYQGHTFGAIYVGNNSYTSAFNQQSLELMTIYASQAAVLVQNALHINALKMRTQKLKESLELSKFGGIIGSCESMQTVFLHVEKVALSDVGVLICGEKGVGKEQIAREIHVRSSRKDAPFVIMNCSAIPAEQLESELFGHVRGAFVGATQSKIGKLQASHAGILFLDEIWGLPLHVQLKLVQALQEKQVSKLGDNKSEAIDVRLVAASSKDLMKLVENGEFREDLYYRLNVVEIVVPPLRERGNDVLVMANYFLQKYAKVYGKEIIGFLEQAQDALLNYHWPGNVRQLENRIRRAVVMCDQNRISLSDLDIEIDESQGVLPLADALEKFRKRYIAESLERNAGNKTKSAHELGVDPRTIFRYLEKKNKSHEDALDS